MLGLLGHVDRPISGYDLKKLVDSSLGYIWQPSKTQLYAVLPRLLDTGLATRREVEQRDRPDKQLYRINGPGRVAMREWLDRDEDTSDPDRSILVLKLYFGRQGSREALVRQVTAFRAAYALRLATYEGKWHRNYESAECASDEFRSLTLRYGIARARAAVDWADVALKELA